MSNLPSCLPGYSSRRRGKADARKQNFVYVNGYAVEKPPAPVGESGAERFEALQAQKRAMAENPETKFRPGGKGSMPSWLANDRQVLQMMAYFKESVQESDAENFRQRMCTIFFYLADGSVEITENKLENSGIPQGKFVKRHRIPIKDQQTGQKREIAVTDLQIGTNVEIYGRVFHVYDCNPSTREYLKENGMPAPPAEQVESDDYSQKRSATMDRETGNNPDRFRGVKMNPMKSFMEAKLGKTRQKDLKEFLKNDGKVLRFHCQWDDTDTYSGLLHKYTMHYFLADHTIELLEDYEPNSGQDNFPKLLSRSKLPKNGQPCPRGDEENLDLFVRWEDLNIGQFVNVYNRQVKLLSVDDMTRQYYRANGKYLADDLPYTTKAKPVVPKQQPPAHNGFGSEEDSLGSCSQLMPKPPKKNYHKMLNNDRKNLKFSAFIDSDKREDRLRKFVLTYYLGDDTISVFEPQQRNSGIVGGKFLKRQRLKNSRQEYLRASHFFVGAKVVLAGFKFVVSDIDEFSLKYMEQNHGEFPMANIKVILSKLVRKLKSQSSDLRTTFNGIDADNSGSITMPELETCLYKYFTPTELTKQEVLTIMRYFDEDKSGRIDYMEFAAKLNSQELETGSGEFFESGVGGQYGATVNGVQYDDLDKKDTMASVKHFQSQLAKTKQKRSKMLQSFRLNDVTLSNQLPVGKIQGIIESVAELSSADADRVVRHFFGSNPSAKVDYKTFADVVR